MVYGSSVAVAGTFIPNPVIYDHAILFPILLQGRAFHCCIFADEARRGTIVRKPLPVPSGCDILPPKWLSVQSFPSCRNPEGLQGWIFLPSAQPSKELLAKRGW